MTPFNECGFTNHRNESHTSLKGAKENFPMFSKIFGAYMSFLKILCSEKHTLRTGVNKFLPALFYLMR